MKELRELNKLKRLREIDMSKPGSKQEVLRALGQMRGNGIKMSRMGAEMAKIGAQMGRAGARIDRVEGEMERLGEELQSLIEGENEDAKVKGQRRLV